MTATQYITGHRNSAPILTTVTMIIGRCGFDREASLFSFNR